VRARRLDDRAEERARGGVLLDEILGVPLHREDEAPLVLVLEGLDHLVGMFVRLDHPVDFEALDEQPSDLIFLLLAPSAAEADSLKALARISRMLRDPGLRQRLRQERDPRVVYRMLTQKPECHAA